jgi:hypothetical protein
MFCHLIQWRLIFDQNYLNSNRLDLEVVEEDKEADPQEVKASTPALSA